MKPLSETQAFLKLKCPRCRQGNLFSKHPYDLRYFGQMEKSCPVCHLNFEIEPGFFIGAMYFSYAINVVIIAISGVLLNVFTSFSIYMVICLVLVAVFLALPLNFRYSRMMTIKLFSSIKYDPKYENDRH